MHDVGRDREGRPYFAMKRIRGQSLGEVLRSGGLPMLVSRLEVFAKVCDAVAFAHEHGIVHRDLKPSNVMVGAFGEVLLVGAGPGFSGPPEPQRTQRLASAAILRRDWPLARRLLDRAVAAGQPVDPVDVARAHWLTGDRPGARDALATAIARGGDLASLQVWAAAP